MGNDALTAKQSLFVNGVLAGLSQKDAAIAAGFSAKSADAQAAVIVKIPKVKAAIDEALRRRSERVEVKADDILRELARVGMSDIGEAFDENGMMRPLSEMPVGVRRAISSVEVEDIFEGRGAERVRVGTLTKVKFWDKTRGLEMLGKNLKLFTEVHEVKVTDLGDRMRKARQRADSR